MINTKATEFLKVINDHKRLIYKVAHFYCKDDFNREDLVQEIIIQLWRSFESYNESFKMSTWIYRIALNTSISLFRTEIKRKDLSLPISESSIHFAASESTNNYGPEINQLHSFIKELKELDRALIILYLDENSSKQIAQIMGLSETNVSTRISRIKKTLKLKFENLKKQEK